MTKVSALGKSGAMMTRLPPNHLNAILEDNASEVVADWNNRSRSRQLVVY
jgi:hypothetical protein